MQSVLGHQAGRPAVRDMTNTGDATMNIEHQPGFHLYPCHLQHVVHSEHALQTHMQRHNQCTVKVYFTHFGKYDSSTSSHCIVPLPPHHLLLPSLEAPGTGGTGWGRRGREGGRKSEASNSITGKTRLEQWFTCWSCALHWEHVLCNVEAVHWCPVQIGGGWCSACGLVTGGKV